MDEGVDTGPVYFKESLDLDGTALEIYSRAAELTWIMMQKLVEENPSPEPQDGEVVTFSRRLPIESELPQFDSLDKVYDFIRMLDAPGYPHAFINFGNYLITLKDANYDGEDFNAKVSIKLKGDLDE